MAKQLQILSDGLFELLLLLDRVGVVKQNNEFAIKCLVGKIAVEKSGFGMVDVQVFPVFS